METVKAPLAVKVLQKRAVVKVSQLRRLNAEIRILSKLHHPSIPSFHDVAHSHHFIWILTEKSGQNLLDWWRSYSQQISFSCLQSIMLSLFEGMEYLESCGVAHRDIKMNNLLVKEIRTTQANESGHSSHVASALGEEPMFPSPIKRTNSVSLHSLSNGSTIIPPHLISIQICDFGFACDQELMDSQGTVDDFCGTPGFFAPELVTQPRWDPIQADRWSIGCLMLQLLVGDTEFHQRWLNAFKSDLFDNPQEFLTAIQNAKSNIRDSIYLLARRGYIKEARIMPPDTLVLIIEHMLSLLNECPEQRMSFSQSLQQSWMKIKLSQQFNQVIDSGASNRDLQTIALPSGISSRGIAENGDESSDSILKSRPLAAIIASKPTNKGNNIFRKPQPPPEQRCSFRDNSPREKHFKSEEITT